MAGGHTAHASQAHAAAYARRIHADVYLSALQDVLAIPVLTGLKTEAERFAGAATTLTWRAFDITYTEEHGAAQHCWTTSWGSTTRLIGGLIMVHGDDAGLRLPPRVAPVQVIIVAVKDAPGVFEMVGRLERQLDDLGTRVRVVRRDDSQSDLVSVAVAAAAAAAAVDAAQDGFARLPFSACDEEGERILNAAGISIRCITTREGTVPDGLEDDDLLAIAARAY